MTVKINNDFEIYTPNGWKDFSGIMKTQHKKVRIQLLFDDETSVIASPDHQFYIDTNLVKVSELVVGDKLDSIENPKEIVEIKNLETDFMYDIVEVDHPEHKFCLSHCLITKNCDEFSFVRDNIQQSFFSAIRPTLSSSDGDSIITSTPGNDEDIFAQIWRGANDNILPDGTESKVGSNGYVPNFATWRDHPDRTEEWAEAEKRAMGEEKFLREHENRFISFEETLIDSMVLSRLEPKDPIFNMGEVRWFKKPEFGCSYYAVLDPSLGTKGDWSAIQVIEMPTLEHVAEWSSNTTPPPKQVQVLYDILNYLKHELAFDDDVDDDDLPIYWSFENNSIGEAVLQTVEDSGIDMFPGYLISEKRKGPATRRRFRKGINTTNKNKVLACSKFKSLVDTGKLVPKSIGTIKQLKSFAAKGASFAASSGNDDLIMALIMCVRIIEMTKNWDIYDVDIMSDKIETEFSEPVGFII